MRAIDHGRVFELADSNGTPMFVYSEQRLDDAAQEFKAFTAQMPFPSEVYYSYKTNYLPALCERLASPGVGLGAEVTSTLEWELASRHVPPSRIVVNGIGKSAGLLDRALDGEPPRLINVETDTEVERLRTLASRRSPARVGLRVAVPDVSGEHGQDPSIHWRRGVPKFGWRIDRPEVVAAAKALAESPALELEALHLHLGGQLVSARVYETALDGALGLLERLAQLGILITTLDVGGGLASGWVEKRRTGPLFELLQAAGVPAPAQPQCFADLGGIAAAFSARAPRLRRLGVERLLFEPRRILAEPAMAAVATVVAVRHDGDRRHAVLDLGTNALHCWRSDEQRPIIVDLVDRGGELTYELVGPLCHRSDTFGTIMVSEPLRAGVKVCLDAVGAYSLGDWIANTWERPPVVRLHDGAVLWQRQTAEQFWSQEKRVVPDYVEGLA